MSDRAAESETAILTQFLNLDNIQTFKTRNVETCGVDGGPSIPPIFSYYSRHYNRDLKG